MVNRLYASGRQGFLQGDIHWLTDNIKALLVNGGAYSPNTSTDTALSNVPVGSRTAVSPNLANKTATAGVADADDLTFPNVSGPVSGLVVIYKDTGVEATSTLICLIDTANGLPVTPNSGPIAITFDQGASKIFVL